MHSVSESRAVIDSAEVSLFCSVCAHSVETDALRIKTTDKMYGLITVWITHETVIKCPSCGTTQRSSRPLEDLKGLTPDQMGQFFNVRIGFVERFLVVAGWLFFWTGPVSLVMLLIAWFKIPAASRGWSRSALIGVMVAGSLCLFLTIALIVDTMTK